VINATEGGALIRGAKNRKLEEAIETFCTKEIGFRLNDILEQKEITPEMRKAAYQRALDGADQALAQIYCLMDIVRKHSDTLKEYEKFNFEEASLDKLKEILEQFAYGNEIVKYILNKKTVISTFYKHIVKHTIMNVKKIGNTLSGENIQRNWELQANLIYMCGITSDALSKELYNMKDFIMEKEKECNKIQ
jgi:hypothetical protein